MSIHSSENFSDARGPGRHAWCGLLLAMYEDINVFPVLMRGYNTYKDTTPFLFPTKESIRRCFNGKKAK